MFMVNHGWIKMIRFDHGQPWTTMVDNGQPFLQWLTLVDHGQGNDFIMVCDG